MAEQISPLLLSIQLETARLTQQVAGVQGQLKSIGTTAQQSASGFDGFGRAVKGVAGKVVGLAAAYVSLATLQDSMKMAVEARKSMGLFEGQLERSTGATRSQITAINDQIKALSTLSAVSGGTIRTSFQKLVTVTGDLKKSMELQTLAMDVAAGTGKPLAMVTMTLGRAATGTLTSLNRLVPGITAVRDPMAKLEATFKGAAAEAANLDPYARMELRMNSLKKAIGDKLLIVIDSLDKALVAAGPTFKEFAVPIGQATKAIMPFLEAFGKGLLDSLKKLIPAFSNLVRGVLPSLMRLLENMTPLLLMIIDSLINIVIYLEPVITAFADLALVLGNEVFVALNNFIADVERGVQVLKDLRDATMAAFGYVAPEATTVDVTSVHDATDAYIAMTEAQQKAARFALLRPDRLTTGGATSRSEADALKTQTRDALKTLKTTEREYRKAVKQLTEDSNAEMAQLTIDHQKNIAEIMRNGVQTLTDIVKTSQDRLRDAFKNVTQIDAGNMFIDAGASIANFVAMLKDKLTASKRLAQDAANLAAAGYSQTFIEQIVARGPDIGGQLTKQLMAATPEQAAEIQSLFGEVNTSSLHAVDDVAKKITEQQGLATEELRDAYLQAQTELTDALKAENDAFASAMLDTQKALTDAIAAQTATLKKAMRVAEREIGDSAGRILNNIRNLIGTASSTTISALVDTTTTAPVASSATNASQSLATYGGSPINVSISVSTNATAEDIAAAVSNAIKYNLPYTVAGAR